MVEIRHVPVLMKETLDGLDLHTGDTIVDGTLGSGGHSLEIFERIFPGGRLIAMDMDEAAIERFRKRVEPLDWAKKALENGEIRLFHNNFRDMGEVLENEGIEGVSGIMVDLGFSSDQMDSAERGLAFSKDGPLDMRLDQKASLSAYQVVNEYSETDLVKIFREYGEEKFAGNIAKSIVLARKKNAIGTTTELADIVTGAIPKRYRSGKIHPATKTFQALRMEVNRELESLAAFLPQAIEKLKPGGRLAVISFHSGEDRMVKNFFRENARGCICPKEFPICRCGNTAKIRIVTTRPTVPSEEEIARNPRSRSAKLRIAERL